jgi:hypothetical protein
MNRTSGWSSTTEDTSPGTGLDASFELHLDSSYVFIVWVFTCRDIIIVCFAEKGSNGCYGDEAVDGPVVSIGAKI